MNCTHCGFSPSEEYPICPACGQWSVQPPLALPAPKKRRTILPFLLLFGLMAVGITLFFLIPMDQPAPTVPTEVPPSVVETVPHETIPAEGKGLFQKDCFILEAGTLYFDESKFLANPILVVPAAIDEQSVQRLSEFCFEGLEGVTTIILPSSVTEIGARAFAGCTDLRGVCVPNAVKTIGAEAFRGCRNLEAVYLPTGLDAIGTGAFADCPMLTFVFYNGFYEQWESLYPEAITPFTWIICLDGEYRHSAKKP